MERGEEAVAWENALDLGDDNDGGSIPISIPIPIPCPAKRPFPFPSLRRCSSRNLTATTPIPGPAGIVQSAMLQRRRGHRDSDHPVVTTQECIRRAVEDAGSGDDEDFHCDPWLSAVDFVRSQGWIIELGLVDGEGVIGVPLSTIRNRLDKLEKVSQVVAIVQSYNPNGLGDVMATLKDPTGTMNASIHHKVFTEGEFGKGIALGSVLILQKVAVFSPTRSSQCLNITRNNVVKVIAKDGNTHSTDSTMLVDDATPAFARNGSHEMAATPPHSSSTSSQGTAEGLVHGRRHNVFTRPNTQKNEVNLHSTQSSDDVVKSSRNQHSVAVFDKLVPKKRDTGAAAKVPFITVTGMAADDEEVRIFQQDNTNSKEGGCGSSRFKQAAAAPSIVNGNAPINQKHTATGATNERPPSSTSKPSLPQWTDEQLDQLFAFD